MALKGMDKTTKISLGMVITTLVATIAIFVVSFVNRPLPSTVNGFYASTEPLSLAQVNNYFNPDSNSNLKYLLEDRVATTHEQEELLKAVVGKSFTKQAFEGFDVNAPGRQPVTGLSLDEAITEMKAGLATLNSEYNNGLANPIPYEWTNYLGTGQVNWVGTDLSADNFETKPKGLTARNTTASHSGVTSVYWTLNCVFNPAKCAGFIANHTMPGYVWKNWYASNSVGWLEYTHNPGVKITLGDTVALDGFRDQDLGKFVDLPTFQKWHMGPRTTRNSPTNGTLATAQLYNREKKYLYTEGFENEPIKLDTPYYSYYLDDIDSITGNASINGDVNNANDYIKFNYSQFDKNGREIYKYYSQYIPKYKDNNINDAKFYYRTLISLSNAVHGFVNGSISWQYNVSQKGDAVIYDDHKEGVAIKTSASTWDAIEADVDNGKMDRFSNETLTKTIRYLAKENLLHFKEAPINRYAIIKNFGDRNSAETKWMSIDELYKEACTYAKSLVDAQHPGKWEGQCPS